MNRRATGDPAIDLINHSAGLLASLSGHCAVTTSVSLSMVWTLPRMRSKVQGKTAQAEDLGGHSYEVVDLNGAKFSGETYAALRRRKRDVAKRVPLKRIAKSRSRERS
jgi:hypothetical protein